MHSGSRQIPLLLLCAWLLAPLAAVGGADEGIEYFKVNPPQPTANKDKIEVLEAFSYGCPHCYQFEPALTTWKKSLPPNVEFVRFHVIFPNQASWEPLARAYYTAEFLGIVEKIHHAMFVAVHDKKRDLTSDAKMAEFFAEQGVSKKDFQDAYRSFSVDSKMRRAADMTTRYQVDGVPSLVVNGKFRTSARYTGGTNESLLKVIDELVRKESRN